MSSTMADHPVEAKPTMSKWQLTTDPLVLRRMGKTGEEAGELLAVTNRVIIQGLDEIDPGSGKTNRQRLEQEIADVLAQCDSTINALGLDWFSIDKRRMEKVRQMDEWESLYAKPEGEPV